MPLFVLIGRDGPGSAAARKRCRDAHLANLRPLAEAGRVVYAGPLLDGSDQPVGSVIVFDAADRESAQRFATSDPYVVQGVFERWEVLGSRQVFPGAGA
jgi:uncharacterized protein YciI